MLDVLLLGAVENRRNRRKSQRFRHPAEVCLKNLPYVHSARHPQRVEQYVKRRAILKERHILFGQYLRNNALVAMATRNLVSNRHGALGRDIYFDHFYHAAGQLVAVLEPFDSLFAFLLKGLDFLKELIHKFFHLLAHRGRLDPFDVPVGNLFVNDLVILADTDFLSAGRVNNIDLKLLVNRGCHLPEYHALFRPYILFEFPNLGIQRLFAFLAACSPPHKPLGFDYNPFITVGQFK